MLRPRIIPCLLLQHAGLVKTVKFKNPRYIGDPINAVRIFNEKGADEILFLDITATKEGRKPNFQLIERIAEEAFMPFAYGGGVRSMDDMRTLFKLGVEKVVINTYAATNLEFIRESAARFGNQSIVVSVDVKKSFWGKYEVYTSGGTHNTKLNPKEYIHQLEAMGCGEIFLNSIDNDGMMQGYDLTLIKSITGSISIPLVACGGAGDLQHLCSAIKEGGASGAAAGSMFVFYGRLKAVLISYPDLEAIDHLISSQAKMLRNK